MSDKYLAHRRLVAQHLVGGATMSPVQVAEAFGVMQGQDMPGVLASVALRAGTGVGAVVAAVNAGQLVRGYPMRGTVFLAPAADLRWITELCSAGIRRQQLNSYLRRGGTMADIDTLHEQVCAEGGMTRARFRECVASLGHDPQTHQFHAYRILFELLVSNRVVHGRFHEGEQCIIAADQLLGDGLAERFGSDIHAATAELASRYFRTHGPATPEDFAWWSKLPITRIRKALPDLDDDIVHDGEFHFRATLPDELAVVGKKVTAPLLLPGYDEFILGYRDRLFAMTPTVHQGLVPDNRGVFRKAVVVDGTVRAHWSGNPAKNSKLRLTELATVPKASLPVIKRLFTDFPAL